MRTYFTSRSSDLVSMHMFGNESLYAFSHTSEFGHFYIWSCFVKSGAGAPVVRIYVKASTPRELRDMLRQIRQQVDERGADVVAPIGCKKAVDYGGTVITIYSPSLSRALASGQQAYTS